MQFETKKGEKRKLDLMLWGMLVLLIAGIGVYYFKTTPVKISEFQKRVKNNKNILEIDFPQITQNCIRIGQDSSYINALSCEIRLREGTDILEIPYNVYGLSPDFAATQMVIERFREEEIMGKVMEKIHLTMPAQNSTTLESVKEGDVFLISVYEYKEKEVTYQKGKLSALTVILDVVL